MKIPTPFTVEEEHDNWKLLGGISPDSVVHSIDDKVLPIGLREYPELIGKMEEILEEKYKDLQIDAILHGIIYLRYSNNGRPASNETVKFSDVCAAHFLEFIPEVYRFQKAKGEDTFGDPMRHARFLGEVVVEKMKKAELIQKIIEEGSYTLTQKGISFLEAYQREDFENMPRLTEFL